MKKIFFLLLLFSIFQISYAEEGEISCTDDAKLCPDGTWVGRTGPNCEFVCPEYEETIDEDNTYVCNDIYAPVCGALQVQCITTPCYPIEQTFGNDCELTKNGNATYLHEGECENEGAQIISDGIQNAGMANPASVYCVENGGTLEIKKSLNGGEYGVCVFEDNLQCEEWALYRGNCPIGGIKITGYVNEESKFCAITGNEYIFVETLDDGTEIGNCKLESGKIVDAKDFYLNGDSAIEKEVEDELICTAEYNPVCGQDSKTYSNLCFASNVGIKYTGRCLSSSIEERLKSVRDTTYIKYIENKNEVYKALFFEQIILKANTFSKNTNSYVRQSSYSYLGYLAAKNLTSDIYEPFIETNLNEIVNGEPTLGGIWYITEIKWLYENIALINYEDGHISDYSKILISIENGKLKIIKLENKLEITNKIGNQKYNLSIRIPKDWEENYGYKTLNNGKNIQFYYKAKKESNHMLFNVNFFTKDEWQQLIDEGGPLNNIIIAELGDYVISYSRTLDMPYETDENISNYSIMVNEMSSVIDTIEVYFK